MLVFDIARHFRSKKHKWSPRKAKYAKTLLGIRKRNANCTSGKQRDLKTCTICSASVRRLDMHMKISHPPESLREDGGKNKRIWKILIKIYTEWLDSPDTGGLTDITRKRNIRIVQSLLAEKTINCFENVLNENTIREYFQNSIFFHKMGACNCRHLYVLPLHLLQIFAYILIQRNL